MAGITACEVPEGSLLAGFGGPEDYRDCFCREVSGTVSLPEFIERFYCSMAFRPERVVLGLMGRGASDADARTLARGETDRFGVWEVVERRSAHLSGLVAEHGERPASRKGGVEAEGADGRRPPARPPAGPEGRGDRSADALRTTKTQTDEILLLSKGTGTASWLSVEPLEGKTRLLFGSWVGNLEQSGWRFMAKPHQIYSRMLLGGC